MAIPTNAVRFNATTYGATDFVVASAVPSYETPEQANVTDGKTYRYYAQSADGTQWEAGFGLYTISSHTLARTTISGTSNGDQLPVSFVLPPIIDMFASPSTVLEPKVVVNIQTFTSSGTYTPHANLLYAVMEGVGGGGGGGGINSSNAQSGGGGGGGAGGYSRKIATPSMIGVSQAITIGAAGTVSAAGFSNGGAAGDTSVGILLIAKGGAGGLGSNGAGSGGGAGGIAGTGDLTFVGQDGHASLGGTATEYSRGGDGGDSMFGSGGRIGGSTAIVVAGASAKGFGAGGSGAGAPQGSTTGTTAAGGAGTAGYVVITEFCTP